jgi:hypothetical protein
MREPAILGGAGAMRCAHRAGFRLGLAVTPPFVCLSQRTACADRFSLSLAGSRFA